MFTSLIIVLRQRTEKRRKIRWRREWNEGYAAASNIQSRYSGDRLTGDLSEAWAGFGEAFDYGFEQAVRDGRAPVRAAADVERAALGSPVLLHPAE